MVSTALRRVLLRYLAAGLISEHEAARTAAISKQAVHKWCRSAGIDVRAAREKRYMKLAARMRAEVWHSTGIRDAVPVKRSPRRGARGRGKWIDRGKDQLSEG